MRSDSEPTTPEIKIQDHLDLGVLRVGDALVPVDSLFKVEAEITQDAVIAIDHKSFGTLLRAAREMVTQNRLMDF